MAVMTLPRSTMMNRAFMRRALWLSLLVHVVGFGAWLQHWHARQAHYEMPGRLTVVMQSRQAAALPAPPRPVTRTRLKTATPRPPPKAMLTQPAPIVSHKAEPRSEPRSEPVPAETSDSSSPRQQTLPDRPTPAQRAYVPPRVATVIDNPKPYYPRAARRRGMEGLVELRVTVATNGEVARIEVVRSSTYRLLDQAAMDTVRTWRFVPARRGEEVMPGSLLVPVRFSLTEDSAGSRDR